MHEPRPAIEMRWENLLFLHAEVGPEAVAKSLPSGLVPDLHNGRAFVGLVPFAMSGVHPPALPALPGASNFPETNVRTYVRFADGDRADPPMVYFYSLDAGSALAVFIARSQFHLPYFHAAMSVQRSGNCVNYASDRHQSDARCQVQAQVDGDPRTAEPGSLEFFLLERYHFVTPNRDRDLVIGRVAHAPYQFRRVQELRVESSQIVEAAGFEFKEVAHAVFVEAVDVVGYPVRPRPQALR
jgi:uncharacterized protein YqjF (DUF2071 family)